MASIFRHAFTRAALACAMLLAQPWSHARELTTIDALADSPPPALRKAAPALPDHVQRWSREERLGVPTFVHLRVTPAAAAPGRGRSAKDPVGAARAAVRSLAPQYGLTPAEVDAAPVHHVQGLQGGAQLVRFTNQRDGVEVFREQLTVLLDAQFRPTTIGGYLGSTQSASAAKAGPASPMDARISIARALGDWGFDASVAQQLQPSAPPTSGGTDLYQWWALPPGVVGAQGATLPEPVRTKPVWFRLPEGLVRALYIEVLVHEEGEDHTFAYVVADDDGRLLLRHNQTSHAGETFGYRVFADPATLVPMPGAQGRNGTPHPTGLPNGYAAPLVAPNLVSLANVPFSRNDPWLAPGATQTLGNNVHAFANLAAPDGLNTGDEAECGDNLARDFRGCTTSTRVFDYSYDHALGPLANKSQAAASVVNLFYVNNWLHDWFYDAGFDEPAGNAQADNFGRGGLGGDALRAQALDYSGTNNANMWTRADGAESRMRMYRFLNGVGQATVQAPASLAGAYAAGTASFGTQGFDLVADVVKTVPANACTAVAPVAGKIALVDRGSCAFDVKSLAAQAAGAVGVIIVNNQAGLMDMSPSGAGPVAIPVLMISQADGDAWKAQLDASVPVTVRMQRSVTERSSALDNSVIAHEWGHFISNRLIGNAGGLVAQHARGLGEGWGDFHALLMEAIEADRSQAGNAQFEGAYAVGAYATSGVVGPVLDPHNKALYAIRRYPYSTDLTKNPLTLKHIVAGQALPATPPPAFTGDNAEVHNMGEVWSAMLWDCYASLLNAHPFAEAQDRMKRYLVAGYKLTPVDPTLTEARDALLAPMAVSDLADYGRCATTFARRGAGPLALVPNRYSTTNAGVVEDFGTSGVLELTGLSLSMTAPQALRCDADSVLDSGETGVLTITVRNRGASAVTGAQLQLAADLANLQWPDGLLAVPSVDAGASVTVTARVQLAGLSAPATARILATLIQPSQSDTTRTLDLPLHRDQFPNRLTTDDAEADPSAMTFVSTNAAFVSTWGVGFDAALPHQRSYVGAAPGTDGTHKMITPPLQVAATGNFTVSFQHRYRFERDGGGSYDGGQLLISDDNGATWTRVAADYTGTLAMGGNNPAEGQPAYVGQSTGWPAMQAASVNLGTAWAGKTVRLAWAIQTDFTVGTEGWVVDDIAIGGIANLPFPQVVADAQACAGTSSVAAASGTPQSAPVGSVFGLPLRVRLLSGANAPLPGILVNFSAPASGATATLSATTAVTDANGEASVTATANLQQGSYVVTASAASGTASFALRNTAAATGTGGPGGGGGPLSISGASPNGQGTVTATVQSSVTPLPSQAYFSQAAFSSEAGAGVPTLAGRNFPYGLVSFSLENVGLGNTVTLRIQYPGPVPAGAQYWKYGRTSPSGAPTWYQIPMVQIAANTIEISLTDGGSGDHDAQTDGTITDPGGLSALAAPVPGAEGAAPIPLLSPLGMALLAAGVGLLGWRRQRRHGG